MTRHTLLAVVCAVSVLLLPLVMIDRVDEAFLSTHPGAALTPRGAPPVAGALGHGLRVLRPGPAAAARGPSAQRAPHAQGFPLTSRSPLPELPDVTDVCGSGFRHPLQFLKPVFVIVFSAAHLSSAWKLMYILCIPLPWHLKAFSSFFHINQTICVPCTMWIPLRQVLSARGK